MLDVLLNEGFPFPALLIGDPLNHVHGENALAPGTVGRGGGGGGPDSWPGASLPLLPSSLKVQPTTALSLLGWPSVPRRQGSWAPRRRGRTEEPSPAGLDGNNPRKTPKYKTDLEGRPVLFKET